jgi:hypothetical protein
MERLPNARSPSESARADRHSRMDRAPVTCLANSQHESCALAQTRAEAAVDLAESVSFRMRDLCDNRSVLFEAYEHFVERWNLRAAATTQYRRTLVPTLQARGGAAALSVPTELLHLICECII